MIYDFYLNYPNLPVYFIIEWDTYCNCSLENFYGNSLNMNHFSHIIHKEESLKDWIWYKKLTKNQKLISNIGGITPTSGMLFTKSVLSSMVNLMINNPKQYNNMFSELRLGTLLQQSGYILTKPFFNSESYINWNIDSITFDPLKPGYYHPIKTIV